MPAVAVQTDAKDADKRTRSFDHGRDTSSPAAEFDTAEARGTQTDAGGENVVQMAPNLRSAPVSPKPPATPAVEMAPNPASESPMSVESESDEETEEISEEMEAVEMGPQGGRADTPPEDEDSQPEEATARMRREMIGESTSATPPDGSAQESTGAESTESEMPAKEEGTAEHAEQKEAGKGKKEERDKTKGEEKAKEEQAPRSPEEDPDFQAVVSKVKKRAGQQKAHRPAKTEVDTAQLAAPSPENETKSIAQAQQVEEMDKQEAGTFDAKTFKKLLMDRIAAILPTNEKEADEFSEDNRMNEVKQAASQQAKEEREKAAGSIESSTKKEPDTGEVTPREPTELDEPKIGREPKKIGAAKAMPKPRSESQVSQPLKENMSEVNQKMSEADVTDEQLANSNEPTFAQALNKKKKAKENTEKAPAKFRKKEKTVLNSSRSQAQTKSKRQLEGMHGDRSDLIGQVKGQQQELMNKDTAERKKIASDIDKIYEKTKTDVEGILSTLDEEVNSRFEKGADRAKRAFEDYVAQKMDAYKEERYGAWFDVTGWDERIGDAVTGLPEEVNKFFMDGRQLYINKMDIVLTGIADYVAEKLNKATQRINEGKQNVQEYVTDLPENLQEVGQDAAEEVQSRFDKLQQSVNSKQDELVNSLARQYKENLEAVDARIEEMKAENRGLIDVALGAITGVIETIIKIKNMLTNMVSGAVAAVRAIIADPIGFLGNLIQGVKQGFTNFMSRILEHLQSGLIGWLTGALGPVGIEIPDNLFSLKGIFSLVMQVLGLTWGYVREKAVQLFGEPVVKAMEAGLEIFKILRSEGISGLWEYVKEKFTDLKETVIGAIKDMIITQVIQAGAKWVMGLLNPAGAFVKAAMLIIDIVKFFIQRGRQIIELVNAISQSLRAIAAGNVGQVAAKVEQALKRAVPVLIGFLASLLGISGLARKVQNLIRKIRTRIDEAITKVLMKAKKMAGKFLAKLGIGGRDKSRPDPRTPEEHREDIDDAVKEANQYLDEKDASPEGVQDKLPGLKTKYNLTEAELKQNRSNGKYYIEVKGSLGKKTDEEELKSKSQKNQSDAATTKISRTKAQRDYLESLINDPDSSLVKGSDGKLYNRLNDREIVVNWQAKVLYADTKRPCFQCDPAYRLEGGSWRGIPDDELSVERKRVQEENKFSKPEKVTEPDSETKRNWMKIGGKTFSRMKGKAGIFKRLWNDAAQFKDNLLIESVLRGETSLLLKKNVDYTRKALNILNEENAEASKKAARDVAEKLYNNHRNRFYTRVRNSSLARGLLEDAGWHVRENKVPINKFSGEDLTIEHSVRKVDDPSRALDPDVLMFSPRPENTVILEGLRRIEEYNRIERDKRGFKEVHHDESLPEIVEN